MNRLLVAALAVFASVVGACAQQSMQRMSPPSTKEYSDLRDKLHDIGFGISAEIGVAFFDSRAMVDYSDSEQYPLLSVMKFHQALAVCDELEKTGRTLDDSIAVSRKDLRKDTWSPMRDKYPKGGRFTIEELLWYSLVQSDNNACDILFDKVTSVEKTQAFVDSVLTKDRHYVVDSVLTRGCHIAVDEKTMGEDVMRCYENWTDNYATIILMDWFYKKSEKPLYSNVWQMMAKCETGSNRIPRYLGDDVVVVHKTGTGPVVDGKIIAVNDVACILLPDGQCFFLTVFMRDARIVRCPMEKCEETIAQIAKLCMDFVKENSHK